MQDARVADSLLQLMGEAALLEAAAQEDAWSVASDALMKHTAVLTYGPRDIRNIYKRHTGKMMYGGSIGGYPAHVREYAMHDMAILLSYVYLGSFGPESESKSDADFESDEGFESDSDSY